jgi:prophage antirepressor-like protein
MSLGTYSFKLDDNRTAPIHVLEHKGREVWITQEIGAALDYEDPRKLAFNISGDWSGRFRDGVDFLKVEGEDLAALKRLATETVASGADPIIHPRTPSLLLLTESGVFLACALAKTEAGDRFRWWLADEVLPSIRRTGSYTMARGPGRPRKDGQPSPQGDLFTQTALQPFTPTSAPHVAFKCLTLLRREGRISPNHHHEQLATLTGRITGLEVELLPIPVEPDNIHKAPSSDPFGRFVQEHLVFEPGAKTSARALYEAFLEQGGGLTQNMFGRRLNGIGCTTLATNSARYWVGVRLRQNQAWEAFVLAWREVFGFANTEAHELYALCLARGLMRSALGEGNQDSQKIRLAKLLARQAAAGLVERRGSNTQNNTVLWGLPRPRIIDVAPCDDQDEPTKH